MCGYIIKGTICLLVYIYLVNGENLILRGPENQKVKEGDTNIRFTCLLNVNPKTLVWMKNSTNITEDEHYSWWNDDELKKTTLEIKTVQRTDKGYYQCKVWKNRKNQESARAYLEVIEITGEPYPICELSKSVYEECEMVEMTCITENKWPADDIDFKAEHHKSFKSPPYYIHPKVEHEKQSMFYMVFPSLMSPMSEKLNTTSQCSNATHLWATSEFKADRKINKAVCTIINSDILTPRSCKKVITIHPSTTTKEMPTTPAPTEVTKRSTKPATEEPEDDNKPTDRCKFECNDKENIDTIKHLLITILVFQVLTFIARFCLFIRDTSQRVTTSP